VNFCHPEPVLLGPREGEETAPERDPLDGGVEPVCPKGWKPLFELTFEPPVDPLLEPLNPFGPLLGRTFELPPGRGTSCPVPGALLCRFRLPLF
jgi:hypothetical protein